MLPPPLRFDLLPRRPRRRLQAALLGLVAAALAAAGAWLLPRQAELASLREAVDQARQQQQPRPSLTAPATLPAAWQAAAAQDGRLFALTLEPRLLEVERCTDNQAMVTRFAHDEWTSSSTLELSAATADQVSALVECLNAGGEGARHWRLTGVEVQQSPKADMASPARRVALRRD